MWNGALSSQSRIITVSQQLHLKEKLRGQFLQKSHFIEIFKLLSIIKFWIFIDVPDRMLQNYPKKFCQQKLFMLLMYSRATNFSNGYPCLEWETLLQLKAVFRTLLYIFPLYFEISELVWKLKWPVNQPLFLMEPPNKLKCYTIVLH